MQWEEKYKKILNKHDQQDLFIKKLQHIDYDNLSPKQAFDLLWSLQQDLKIL